MPAKSSGTSKPYLHFIGGNAASVTGSCTIVRFDNIKLAVDMGLIQTNNLVADYRANRDQMKKIKPKTVHGVIITHLHADIFMSYWVPAEYESRIQSTILNNAATSAVSACSFP